MNLTQKGINVHSDKPLVIYTDLHKMFGNQSRYFKQKHKLKWVFFCHRIEYEET